MADTTVVGTRRPREGGEDEREAKRPRLTPAAFGAALGRALAACAGGNLEAAISIVRGALSAACGARREVTSALCRVNYIPFPLFAGEPEDEDDDDTCLICRAEPRATVSTKTTSSPLTRFAGPHGLRTYAALRRLRLASRRCSYLCVSHVPRTAVPSPRRRLAPAPGNLCSRCAV